MIYTRWNGNKIDLQINNITINLTDKEAEETFRELSVILYGRILKDDDNIKSNNKEQSPKPPKLEPLKIIKETF